MQIDSFFVGQLQIDNWKIDLVRDPSTVGTTLELGLSDQINETSNFDPQKQRLFIGSRASLQNQGAAPQQLRASYSEN